MSKIRFPLSNPSLSWTIGLVFTLYGLLGDSRYPLAWALAGATILGLSYRHDRKN